MRVQWDCLQHIGCGRGLHDDAFGVWAPNFEGGLSGKLKDRQTQCHN